MFNQSFQSNVFIRFVREYRLDIFLPQQEHCKVYQRLNPLDHTEQNNIFAFYIVKEQILMLSLIQKVSLCN